jgi:YHS domain-containing protein
MAKCPVCENDIDEAAARAETSQTMHGASEVDPTRGTRHFHDGKWYYFDSLDCRSKFMAHPDTYVK